MNKIIFIVLSILMIGCGSYQPILVVNENDDKQMRVARYYSSCCGCEALIIDVKVNNETEIKYVNECNCGRGLRKEVNTISKGLIINTEIYTAISDTDKISKNLSKTDSLVLFNLSKIVNLDFDKCKFVQDTLNKITGFKFQNSFKPIKLKSRFRKKIKM